VPVRDCSFVVARSRAAPSIHFFGPRSLSSFLRARDGSRDAQALLHWRKIDQIVEKTLNEINQRFREFSLKIS
jgi:hypothetical protein